MVEPYGQLIEVFATPRGWEFRVKGVFGLIAGALFLSFAVRYHSGSAILFGLLSMAAGAFGLAIAPHARVEVWATGLRRRRSVRWRFWTWSELQGAYPARTSRFDLSSFPSLLLVSGRSVQLDEFKEPWRVFGRKPEPPAEATALVEAVNLRTGPPPPAPDHAATPIIGRTFLPTALIVVVTFIVALVLVGATTVVLASGPVRVNPATLPVGHRYDVYTTDDGQTLNQVSCPEPIRALGSRDPTCDQHARSTVTGAAIAVTICLTVLALEAWYIVRRRRRRHSAEADVAGVTEDAHEPTDPAGRPMA